MGILLFVVWGAFFVEHLLAWFLRPSASPPRLVWIGQGLHLALLVGLVVALRREFAGSLIVIGAATAFFLGIVGLDAIALLAVTLIPAALYQTHRWLARRHPVR
jgi:hypothetical protein